MRIVNISITCAILPLTYIYLFFLAGCSGSQGDSEQKAKATNSLSQVVFVNVNGKPITADYVRNMVLISAKITELQGKKKLPDSKFPYWANQNAMRIVPSLVASKLMEEEARKSGVKRTTDSDKEILTRYNRLLKCDDASLEKLSSRFSELEGAIADEFARESLLAAYFSKYCNDEVTDRDIALYYFVASNRVAAVEKINADAEKHAQDADVALKTGESWDVVAARFSEDASEDPNNAGFAKEWETFILKDFYVPEVAAALHGKGAGYITPPIKTDGGIMIVRVNSVDSDVYTCSRIYFRTAYCEPVLDRERAMRKLRADKNRDFQLNVLKKIKDSAKIEYPLGTNFTYKIWAEPKKLKKGFNKL